LKELSGTPQEIADQAVEAHVVSNVRRATFEPKGLIGKLFGRIDQAAATEAYVADETEARLIQALIGEAEAAGRATQPEAAGVPDPAVEADAAEIAIVHHDFVTQFDAKMTEAMRLRISDGDSNKMHAWFRIFPPVAHPLMEAVPATDEIDNTPAQPDITLLKSGGDSNPARFVWTRYDRYEDRAPFDLSLVPEHRLEGVIRLALGGDSTLPLVIISEKLGFWRAAQTGYELSSEYEVIVGVKAENEEQEREQRLNGIGQFSTKLEVTPDVIERFTELLAEAQPVTNQLSPQP
jgi:hypothetical protein